MAVGTSEKHLTEFNADALYQANRNAPMVILLPALSLQSELFRHDII